MLNMQPDEIKALLENALHDCHVEVLVDGSHVNLLVVSSEFEGLTPVKKQQLIYSSLSEHITDGSIHAVNMKTLTPSEWEAQQG
jgi:acid stress-induced BolA-like protein IbaG/YrbA